MWRRLFAILQRPIPGTENLERKLLRCLRKLLQHTRKLIFAVFRFLRWFAPLLIALLVIWIIGGNLLASQQEKQVDRDLEQFVSRFPTTGPNNSALKFEELMAALGERNVLGQNTTPTRYLHLPSKSGTNTLDEIQDEVREYLYSQIDKPNDDIDPAPENIRRYLTDH